MWFVQVRLPPNTSDDVDEDPTGNKALWDRGLLNGASQKVRGCESSPPYYCHISHIFVSQGIVCLSSFLLACHVWYVP